MSGTDQVSQITTDIIGGASSVPSKVAQAATDVIGAAAQVKAAAAQLASDIIGAAAQPKASVYNMVLEIIVGPPLNPPLIMGRRRWPLSFYGYPPRPPYPGNPYA